MSDLAVFRRAYPQFAVALSVACHLAIGLALWATATGTLPIPVSLTQVTASHAGWQQLNGESTSAIGRNQMMDVLAAHDAVRIRLTSATADIAATGLAWWSPSRGLWFAADGFPAGATHRTFQVWLLLPNQRRMSPGTVEIGSDGSGRMLSTSAAAIRVPVHTIVTIQLTEMPGLLSFWHSPLVVLTGETLSQ